MDSSTPFVSASDRAQRLITFFYVMIVIEILNGGMTAARLLSQTQTEAGFGEGLFGILYFIVYVLCAVFFVQWMHRAYQNLPALGAQRTRFTPGWAVGYFFVPFVNFIYPLYAMREIWHHSNPATTSASHARPENIPVALLGNWWAFYLIMNLLANLSFRMTLRATQAEQLATGEWIGIVGSMVAIPAALLAIAVVRKIDAFQAEKAAAAQLA